MSGLSVAQLALLGALVDETRALPELGPRESLQPALLDLIRRGAVELRERGVEGTPLSAAAAELALQDERSWSAGQGRQFDVRATESGARAWESSRARRSRAIAELERDARRLRGF